jgi:hypothetical protein
MKTWKTKRKVCRGRKSVRFANRGACKSFKAAFVRTVKKGLLFD